MSTIIVDKIAKSFGSTQAVKDVSFEVHPGEIFGLLGPMDPVKPRPFASFWISIKLILAH